MAQPDPNTTVALEAIAEGIDILQLLACATDNIEWLNDSIPLSKLSELAQSLGYRDAQSVHSQVKHDRDLDECYAKIRQLQVRLAMLDTVEVTLANCGTGGSYAEFDTPADAIVQMDNRIKELTARLATLDAAEAASGHLHKALQMEREIAGHLMIDDPQPQIMQEWHEACDYTNGLMRQMPCLKGHAEYTKAKAALADCGSRGIYTDFDGPADAIMQMAVYIEKLEDESMIKVEITGQDTTETAESSHRHIPERLTKADLAAHVRDLAQAVDAERRLRQEAEQRATKAADRRDQARAVERELRWAAEQRAEHAEALAQLVTPGLPSLLERLANDAEYVSTVDEPYRYMTMPDADNARKLAAQIKEQIKEALDDSQAT